MTGGAPAGRDRGEGRRRPPGAAKQSATVAAVASSLLVLLLPTLVVARSLGEPAAAGEYARLERALAPSSDDPVDSAIARAFYTATVSAPPSAPAEASGAAPAVLVQARRTQVLGVTAIAFLIYLAVLLAAGRLQALLACVAVALLPAVRDAGHVLRPETPATALSLLSLVALQSAALAGSRAPRRRPWRRAVLVGGSLAYGALTAALVAATLPSTWGSLIVPGTVLLLAAAQLAMRGGRIVRRRRLEGTPFRALNRRLLPWTATSLLTPALAVVLLSGDRAVRAGAVVASAPVTGLFPPDGIARWIALGLLALGVVAAVVRVGVRFGRRGRIGADLVLLVYCAAFLLLAAARERAADPLPMLPAVAALLAEGARVLLVLGSALLPRSAAA